MSITGKIKTTNNKIEQSKAQYDLDRQTAKISALLLGSVFKYEFLTDKYILPEKRLVRKSCYYKKTWVFSVMQRIEKANYCRKKYQKLDKTFEFARINYEKKTIKKHNSVNTTQQ